MGAGFPSTALAECATALGAAAEGTVAAIRDGPPLGQYESDAEAAFQIALIVRHAEALACVASEDWRLYPAAVTLARACFETATRVLWMLAPEDPFQRERRWLTHLHEAERYHEQIATARERFGAEAREDRATADQIAEFRLAVTAALPDYVDPPDLRRRPLEQMLHDIDLEEWYSIYRAVSQYPHGTHIATRLYRRNLGANMFTGEFISTESWKSVITLAWHSLEKSTRRLLACLGDDPERYSRTLPRESMDRSFKVLVAR